LRHHAERHPAGSELHVGRARRPVSTVVDGRDPPTVPRFVSPRDPPIAPTAGDAAGEAMSTASIVDMVNDLLKALPSSEGRISGRLDPYLVRSPHRSAPRADLVMGV
jgi:hypothetical protein